MGMNIKGGKITRFSLFSFKTILFIAFVLFLLWQYIDALMFGENSFRVLNHLKEKEKILLEKKRVLKSENQDLQKEYFELKQLEAKE